MKILSAPLKVTLAVTNKCNLYCKHCGVSSTRDSEELTTQEFLNLITDLVRFKVFNLNITGGEPFMRHDIFTILDFLSNLPLRFNINTNATLINEHISKRLSRNNRLDGILVSLDGSNPGIHDKLRGKGAFQATIKGLRALTAYLKEKIGIFTVVTKYNFRDLENIAVLVKSFGIPSVQFEPLLPQGNALYYKQELTLSHKETIFVYDYVEKISQKFGGLIAGNYLTMGEMFRNWDSNPIQKEDSNAKAGRLYNCQGAITKMVIRPDGWVVPCDRLWDLKLGNIREHSLQEIWLQGKPIKEFRSRFLHTVDDIEECKDCLYKSRCHGGCPAVPYYTGKGIIAADPMSCYKIYKEANLRYA